MQSTQSTGRDRGPSELTIYHQATRSERPRRVCACREQPRTHARPVRVCACRSRSAHQRRTLPTLDRPPGSGARVARWPRRHFFCSMSHTTEPGRLLRRKLSWPPARSPEDLGLAGQGGITPGDSEGDGASAPASTPIPTRTTGQKNPGSRCWTTPGSACRRKPPRRARDEQDELRAAFG
ncbi:hypothetical protein ACCO45_009557 [Purpureocillium lilacinum]|uniref:Uncharacterized protein n=1 Tax=Purpureocillium lilacinum TaxID=33203 RepID=A0ACC4DMN4_PURLI